MKVFTPDVTFDARPAGEKRTFRKGEPVEIANDLADLYVRNGLGTSRPVPRPQPEPEDDGA